MRIHTSLTDAEIRRAAIIHGVRVNRLEPHGSRKRDGAFEVQLYGTSSRRTMDNSGPAATWDEWGVFMSRILQWDPDALLGREDAYAFDYRTCGRFQFDRLIPVPGHNHKWEYVAPFYFQCVKCDAEVRTQ